MIAPTSLRPSLLAALCATAVLGCSAPPPPADADANALDSTLADTAREATAPEATAPDAADDAALDAGLDALAPDALDASPPDASKPDADDDARADAAPDAAPAGVRVRIVAANLTSGSGQSYTPGHGIRILRALRPDIVLIQEFNYATNSGADLRAFVDMTFGAGFAYARGGGDIPNGVISRYPIVASGEWVDTLVANRTFVWARIDVPGARDLWAVSLHLLSSSSTSRAAEAAAVTMRVQADVPAPDLLVVGGDFNTDPRTETAVANFAPIVDTAGPYPADQAGNDNTNSTRVRPYDWVLVDRDLGAREVAVELGANRFARGLVLDTRVYTPLADIAPAMATDSAASGMQHMAVVRDFALEP